MKLLNSIQFNASKETIFMHAVTLNVFPAELRMYIMCRVFVLGICSLTKGYNELKKKRDGFRTQSRPKIKKNLKLSSENHLVLCAS